MHPDSGQDARGRSPWAGWTNALLLLLVASGSAVVLAPPALWLNAAPERARESRPAPVEEPRSGAVFGSDEQLVDVRIEGNTTIPAEYIAKYIKTRPGRPYTQKQIQDDVRSLFGTKWFFSVEPRFRRTKTGLVLIFHVIERPVVRRVVYEGNKRITTKALSKITGLKPGSPFVVSANRESARRIKKYYFEKGFIFAKVELERGGKKDDNEVVFRIEEGPKVRVASVKFEGNSFVSGPVLRTKIRTSTAWVWLIGGLFDPATIDDDISALKQYYFNLGFFDVHIENEQRFNKSRSLVTLVYKIKEGPRYSVRRVQIAGNRVLPTEKIRQDLRLVEGKPFSAFDLAKDIDKIKEKYGEMGRLFASVEAAPRFLEGEAGKADLVYRIDEDYVYRIRRINIVFRDGNAHTQRAVVLNRMLIHPGDLANPRLIRRSELRLRGTQIFADGRRTPGNGPEIVFRRLKTDQIARNNAFRGQSDDRGGADSPAPVRLHPLARKTLRKSGGLSTNRLSRPAGENLFDLATLRRDGTPVREKESRPFGKPGYDMRSRRRSAFDELPRRPNPPPAAPPSKDPLPFTDGVPPAFYINEPERPTFRGQNIENGIEQPGSPFMNDDPNRPFPGAVREGDLLVKISETQTGRLMFGVGVNSSAGVVGSIVLNEYNFDILRPPRSFQDILDGTAWRGGGQRFRMEAIPGNIVSRYLISWTDPYFLNTNYSLGVSGFYYNRFLPDWEERRTGGRINVGRQWTPYFSTSGTFRLEEVVVRNPDHPVPQLVLDVLGSNVLSTVGVNVAHDTRDQAFMPGDGHLLQFDFEQAVGDFQYPRLTLSGSQYFTVHQRPDGLGRHIVTLKGQLGWTDAGTPVFERFYAGGFQTFRGFRFRGVTPRINGIGVGGRWLALGTVQYMLPLMANETLQGVAFSDFGTVENDVNFNDFRLSVGLGLRVTIPALGPVPLAFDFAYPILQEDFDNRRIFSFYVGITQ